MPTVTRDLIPGLLAAVITLTSTLSYVAFIFAAAPGSTLHYAVGFGLICAGVMGIVFALGSKVPFAIAGPDSKTIAVLAIATTVVVGAAGTKIAPDALGLVILAALAAGTIATGAAMYLLGVFRLGQWVRFVPYPVVGGFMAASGWLLAIGGIGLLVGHRVSLSSLRDIAAGPHLPELAYGILFAVGNALVSRIRNALAFPLYLVAAILTIHALLALMGFSIDGARDAGWLFNVGGGLKFVNPLQFPHALGVLNLATIEKLAGEFVALFAVTAISLLLGLVVIEVEGRLDVDLDSELRLNGLANLLVGAAGGMVGTVSITRTIFNHQSGARGRMSGLICGVACLAVLGLGTRVLVYFPVPVLGGLVVYQGASLLYEWLVHGRRTMLLVDYLQVVAIMIAIIFWDFVAGVALGVVAACVTFAINTSRIRLVKQELDRSNYPSRVDRPVAHQEELVRNGSSIQIMWLHGFVFFGSAHRLLQDVKQMVETCGHGVCHSLVLDFREVLGIDSSAILYLGKLWNFAEREGFTIALSSLAPPVEKALRVGGLIRQGHSIATVFPDLDAALEWCEDNLIAERSGGEAQVHSADEWLSQELENPELIARLVSYLELLRFDAGEYIFKQGEPADAFYFLYEGRVTILFTTPDGTEIRLRSMLGRTVLGEMGLYRTRPRTASVRADKPCVAYALSTDAMAQIEADDPTLAYAVHKFIVRVLSSRLEFANREIAGLQG
ncbi:MAG TPA: SulP family inorganic anion transporter [Rhizomicrobium sp.]